MLADSRMQTEPGCRRPACRVAWWNSLGSRICLIFTALDSLPLPHTLLPVPELPIWPGTRLNLGHMSLPLKSTAIVTDQLKALSSGQRGREKRTHVTDPLSVSPSSARRTLCPQVFSILPALSTERYQTRGSHSPGGQAPTPCIGLW